MPRSTEDFPVFFDLFFSICCICLPICFSHSFQLSRRPFWVSRTICLLQFIFSSGGTGLSISFIFLLTRYTCTFLFYGTTRYLPTIGYQRKKGRYTDHGGIIDSGVFLRPTSTIGRLGTVRGYQFKGKVPFGHPGLPF